MMFTNGAIVARVYEDGSNETIANFQYDSQAILFARGLLETPSEQACKTKMIVVNYYDGKITIVGSTSEINTRK